MNTSNVCEMGLDTSTALFYKSVVDASFDAILITDLDGIIKAANPSVLRMFGYKQNELVGFHIDKLIPEALREVHKSYLVQKEGVEQALVINLRREVPVRQKGGESINARIVITEFVSSNNKFYVATFSDISAWIDARNVAETANNAKSRFISSMSHELRTPLNAILGFSTLLKESANQVLSTSQIKWVDHIRSAGSHLLDLINDIVDLSYIESGRLKLTIEDVDALAVIREAMMMVQGMADTRGIIIQFNPPSSGIGWIRADYRRTREVLLNLLSNAIKYNRSNGTVCISEVIGANDFLRITVTDTGHGIPPERQQDVFKPYSRLGAESTAIEGTGLGLTITRQIMLLMGGKIGFKSEIGEGSVFWVEFPRAASLPPAHMGT